jgi:hypothetical protein
MGSIKLVALVGITWAAGMGHTSCSGRPVVSRPWRFGSANLRHGKSGSGGVGVREVGVRPWFLLFRSRPAGTLASGQVVTGQDFGNRDVNPPVAPGPVFPSSPGDEPTATVGRLDTDTAVATAADRCDGPEPPRTDRPPGPRPASSPTSPSSC